MIPASQLLVFRGRGVLVLLVGRDSTWGASTATWWTAWKGDGTRGRRREWWPRARGGHPGVWAAGSRAVETGKGPPGLGWRCPCFAPETGQSAGGCQGTGFGDQTLLRRIFRRGVPPRQDPAGMKIVHRRGCLEPPEGTWGLCGPPATYAL